VEESRDIESRILSTGRKRERQASDDELVKLGVDAPGGNNDGLG
jgi:hypothetical protein